DPQGEGGVTSGRRRSGIMGSWDPQRLAPALPHPPI
ncbi:hypothetical protein CFC21_069316, partial [Triticum aestivum]